MDKDLKALYEAVSAKFDIGTWEEFQGKMRTPQQRRNFYDAVTNKGFSLGSYDDYEKRLKKNGTLDSDGLPEVMALPSQGAQDSSASPASNLQITPGMEYKKPEAEVQEQEQMVDIPEGEAAKMFKMNMQNLKGGIADFTNRLGQGVLTYLLPEKELAEFNKLDPKAREVVTQSLFGPVQSGGVGELTEQAKQYYKNADAIAETLTQYETRITEDLLSGTNTIQGAKRLANEVVGTIPSIMMAMIPGGIGIGMMGASSYSQKMRDRELEGKDLSVKGTTNAVVYGAAEAAFELVTARIGKAVIKSWRGSEDAAKTFVETLLINFGLNPIEEGASEGLTALAQTLSDALIEGDEVNWNEAWKDIADQAVVGAAAGGGMGAVGQTGDAYQRWAQLKNRTKIMNKAKVENISELYQNDDLVNGNQISMARMSHTERILKDELEDLVGENKMTQAEADAVMTRFNRVKKADGMIPKGLGGAKAMAAVNLLNRKLQLEKDIEGKDPALVEDEKKEIETINEQLKNLKNGKLPETKKSKDTEEAAKPAADQTTWDNFVGEDGTDNRLEIFTDEEIANQKKGKKPSKKSKEIAMKAGLKARNVEELTQINKDLWELDDDKAYATAILQDLMIGNMAKREGKTKAEMYDKILFRKGDEQTIKDLKAGKALFQGDALWHSNTERALNGITNKEGKPEEWKSWLAKNGEKGTSSEMDFLGLDEFMADYIKENKTDKVPKQAIQQFVQDNQIEIKEVELNYKERSMLMNTISDLNEKDIALKDELEALAQTDENQKRIKEITKEREGIINEIGKAYDRINSTELKDSEPYFTPRTLNQGRDYREILLTWPFKDVDLPKGYKAVKDRGFWFVQDSQGNKVRKSGHQNKSKAIEGAVTELLKTIPNELRRDGSQRHLYHWHAKYSNVLAHARVKTFTDVDGTKVLVVEELQSDWGQMWRDKYKLGREFMDGVNIPKNMPYNTTKQWLGLATRRLIKMAADEGFDRIAWQNGMQAVAKAKESLMDVVEVEYTVYENGNLDLEFVDKFGNRKTLGNISRKELAKKFDNKLMKKIFEGTDGLRQNKMQHALPQGVEQRGFFPIEGIQSSMNIGLAYFYDVIVPRQILAEAKRFGYDGDIVHVDLKGTFKEWYKKNNPVKGTPWEAFNSLSLDKRNEVIRQFYSHANKTGKSIGIQATIPMTSKMRMNAYSSIPLFQGPSGAYQNLGHTYVIYALNNPNVSTPLHEMAHVYEQTLRPEERKDILKWAGHDKWTVETSEAFARGFENYLATGKAPNPELESIFQKFKNWMLEIYKKIKGSDIDFKLSPRMNEIYRDMLSNVEEVHKTETKVAEKNGVAQADIAALQELNRKTFGLKGQQLQAATELMDVMIDALAKKVNMTKEQVYNELIGDGPKTLFQEPYKYKSRAIETVLDANFDEGTAEDWLEYFMANIHLLGDFKHPEDLAMILKYWEEYLGYTPLNKKQIAAIIEDDIYTVEEFFLDGESRYFANQREYKEFFYIDLGLQDYIHSYAMWGNPYKDTSLKGIMQEPVHIPIEDLVKEYIRQYQLDDPTGLKYRDYDGATVTGTYFKAKDPKSRQAKGYKTPHKGQVLLKVTDRKTKRENQIIKTILRNFPFAPLEKWARNPEKFVTDYVAPNDKKLAAVLLSIIDSRKTRPEFQTDKVISNQFASMSYEKRTLAGGEKVLLIQPAQSNWTASSRFDGADLKLDDRSLLNTFKTLRLIKDEIQTLNQYWLDLIEEEKLGIPQPEKAQVKKRILHLYEQVKVYEETIENQADAKLQKPPFMPHEINVIFHKRMLKYAVEQGMDGIGTYDPFMDAIDMGVVLPIEAPLFKRSEQDPSLVNLQFPWQLQGAVDHKLFQNMDAQDLGYHLGPWSDEIILDFFENPNLESKIYKEWEIFFAPKGQTEVIKAMSYSTLNLQMLKAFVDEVSAENGNFEFPQIIDQELQGLSTENTNQWMGYGDMELDYEVFEVLDSLALGEMPYWDVRPKLEKLGYEMEHNAVNEILVFKRIPRSEVPNELKELRYEVQREISLLGKGKEHGALLELKSFETYKQRAEELGYHVVYGNLYHNEFELSTTPAMPFDEAPADVANVIWRNTVERDMLASEYVNQMWDLGYDTVHVPVHGIKVRKMVETVRNDFQSKVKTIMFNDFLKEKLPQLPQTLFQEPSEPADDSRRVFKAVSDPDVTTPVRQLAGVYSKYLNPEEREKVMAWAGHKKWNHHTTAKFEQGFIEFIRTEKAPSSQLTKIFQQFKQWLTRIVQTVTKYKSLKLNDDMRAIYMEMLNVSKEKKGVRFWDSKDAYHTNNGAYQLVRNEDGVMELQLKTGKPAKVTAQTRRKYEQEYIRNTEFDKGQKALADNKMVMEPEKEVALFSFNPLEMAKMLVVGEFDVKLDPVMESIAKLLKGKVLPKSWDFYEETKNLEVDKKYFDITGYTLPKIASIVSKETGVKVTDKDVIDFMTKWPSGPDAFLNQGSVAKQLLEKRFENLTGLKPTKSNLEAMTGLAVLEPQKTKPVKRATKPVDDGVNHSEEPAFELEVTVKKETPKIQKVAKRKRGAVTPKEEPVKTPTKRATKTVVKKETKNPATTEDPQRYTDTEFLDDTPTTFKTKKKGQGWYQYENKKGLITIEQLDSGAWQGTIRVFDGMSEYPSADTGKPVLMDRPVANMDSAIYGKTFKEVSGVIRDFVIEHHRAKKVQKASVTKTARRTKTVKSNPLDDMHTADGTSLRKTKAISKTPTKKEASEKPLGRMAKEISNEISKNREAKDKSYSVWIERVANGNWVDRVSGRKITKEGRKWNLHDSKGRIEHTEPSLGALQYWVRNDNIEAGREQYNPETKQSVKSAAQPEEVSKNRRTKAVKSHPLDDMSTADGTSLRKRKTIEKSNDPAAKNVPKTTRKTKTTTPKTKTVKPVPPKKINFKIVNKGVYYVVENADTGERLAQVKDFAEAKKWVIKFNRAIQDKLPEASEGNDYKIYVRKVEAGLYVDNVSGLTLKKNGTKWEVKDPTGKKHYSSASFTEAKNWVRKHNIENNLTSPKLKKGDTKFQEPSKEISSDEDANQLLKLARAQIKRLRTKEARWESLRKELSDFIDQNIRADRMKWFKKNDLKKMKTDLRKVKSARSLNKALHRVVDTVNNMESRMLMSKINEQLGRTLERSQSGRLVSNVGPRTVELYNTIKRELYQYNTLRSLRPDDKTYREFDDDYSSALYEELTKMQANNDASLEFVAKNIAYHIIRARVTKDTGTKRHLLTRAHLELEMIYQEGRSEMLAWAEQKRAKLELAKAQARDEAIVTDEAIDATEQELLGRTKTFNQRVKNRAFQLFNGPAIADLDSFFRLVSRKGDDYIYGGYLLGDLMERLREAETNKVFNVRHLTEALQNAHKEFFGSQDEMIKSLTTQHQFQIDKNDRTHYRTLSVAQMLNVWMNYQNVELRPGLENNGYDENFIKQVEAIFTPAEYEFAEWLFNHYENYYERINQVYMTMYGYPMDKPAFYAGRIFRERDKIETRDINDFANPYATTAGASTKHRINTETPISAVDVNMVYAIHMKEMEHFINFAELHSEYGAILHDSQIRKAILTHNPAAGDLIIKGLEYYYKHDLSKGGKDLGVVKWIDQLMSNFVKAKLAIKPKILVTQLLSFTNGAAFMPPEPEYFYYAMNVNRFLEDMKFLNQNSKYLDNRADYKMLAQAVSGLDDVTLDPGISGNQKADWYLRNAAKRFDQLQNILMYNVKLGDKGGILGTTIVYSAWKKKFMDMGMSEAEAEKRAMRRYESAVDRAQQTQSTFGKSQWQRHPLGRYFSMFATSPMQHYRNAQNAAIELKRWRAGDEYKGIPAQHMMRIINFSLFQPIAYTYLSNLFIGTIKSFFDDDDDNETEMDKALLSSLLVGNSGAIPYVGSLLTYLVDIGLLRRESTYGTPGDNPLFESIRNLSNYGKEALTAKTEATRESNRKKFFNEAAILMTGLPVEFSENIAPLLYELATEDNFWDEHDAREVIYKLLGWSPWIVDESLEEEKKKKKTSAPTTLEPNGPLH